MTHLDMAAELSKNCHEQPECTACDLFDSRYGCIADYGIPEFWKVDDALQRHQLLNDAPLC